MPISRREFLTAAGAASALAASGGLNRLLGGVPAEATQGHGTTPAIAENIEHIVVLCMENRSFDHYLGWVPGADGKQAGLSYQDERGLWHDTHRLDTWMGCGFADPGHGYGDGRTQLNGGACDGFRKGGNDDFALGYYEADQLPLHKALVENFAISDRYFCSILSSTYPNRFYTHAAATDRISNTMTQSTLPTIWDRLAAKGISANYYFSDLPFLALWADKYVSISHRVEQFFVDAAAGTLPSYSYLDPFFLGEDQGGSNDDHPHADIRRGQNFIGRVVNALMTSPKWKNTVLVITYDEWGGFFDHVAPPTFDDAFTPTLTEEHNTAGFRVPVYVVSPMARKGAIVRNADPDFKGYDHTSILKLVEWRWGLDPLTPRDAHAKNLVDLLDLGSDNGVTADKIPVIPDPGPHYCQGDNGFGADTVTGMLNHEDFWEKLARSDLLAAWRNVV